MNILIVSNLFPNPVQPERGIFLFQMVKELARRARVRVISPLPRVGGPLAPWLRGRYPFDAVPAQAEMAGIPVHFLRYPFVPKVSGPVHPALMGAGIHGAIKKQMRAQTVDLVNAHWVYPEGVACVRAARRLGLPVMLTARGCDINLYGRMPLRAIQISRSLKAADALTAVSRPLAAAMEKLADGQKKVTVIPNGIDRDLFDILNRRQAREKLNLDPDRSLVVTVGSQDEVKGTAFLIRAAALLNRRVSVACVGDGPLQGELKTLAQNLGMGDRVLFPGQRPHEEIPLWMNAADLFCLSSIREGHPNVILEAMACGVPVAASKVGGAPDMVPRHCGALFSPGKVSEMADALARCLSASWDREAIRAQTVHRTWEKCAKEYVTAYEDLLAGLRGTRRQAG